jgi:hypothetical protein
MRLFHYLKGKVQMCQIKFHLVLVIIGAFFLLSSKEALAFDCPWEGPFLENIEQADLIIRGKILTSHEKTTLLNQPLLEIEIFEIFKGTFDNSIIQAANNPVDDIFLVGTEWILALKQRENGDYTIPDCWDSYLKVEPLVVGNLNDHAEVVANQRVDFDEFKNILQGKDSPSLISYEDGVQFGLQQCKASYEPKNGRLHIPAVDVWNEFGDIITYEVKLIQRLPSFIFDLDLDSVKAHQQ